MIAWLLLCRIWIISCLHRTLRQFISRKIHRSEGCDPEHARKQPFIRARDLLAMMFFTVIQIASPAGDARSSHALCTSAGSSPQQRWHRTDRRVQLSPKL